MRSLAPINERSTTLAIFFVVYNVLLLSFLWFAGRIAIRGPQQGVVTVPQRVLVGRDDLPELTGPVPAGVVLAAEAHSTHGG